MVSSAEGSRDPREGGKGSYHSPEGPGGCESDVHYLEGRKHQRGGVTQSTSVLGTFWVSPHGLKHQGVG